MYFDHILSPFSSTFLSKLQVLFFSNSSLSLSQDAHKYVDVGACSGEYATYRAHIPEENWPSFPLKPQMSLAPQLGARSWVCAGGLTGLSLCRSCADSRCSSLVMSVPAFSSLEEAGVQQSCQTLTMFLPLLPQCSLDLGSKGPCLPLKNNVLSSQHATWLIFFLKNFP